MAKYIEVDKLNVFVEQLCEARDSSRNAYNGSEDEYFLGESETYDECAGLIEAIVREHAITGRLRYGD